MLNRTLSANLNGLNLGTRTLANGYLASLNIVNAQRSVHAHPLKRKDSMRDGMAKAKETSISIRGPISISPSPSSPSVSPPRPYPGRPSRSRSEVVVVVGGSVSVVTAERASGAVRSQAQARQRACGWRRATMTRAESIPVASCFATGG
jgi:hypothetical protein